MDFLLDCLAALLFIEVLQQAETYGKGGGWWLYVHVTSTEEKKLYEEQKQQS